MTPFEKGAENVFRVLGVQPGIVSDIHERVTDLVPTPILELKKELGQSYRATPYSLLFGRYKNSFGEMVKTVKNKLTGN